MASGDGVWEGGSDRNVPRPQSVEDAADLEDVTVLVPAAGSAQEPIFALVPNLPSAMLPVNGKPVIYWQLDSLRHEGYRRFKIGVNARDSRVRRFVETVFGDSLDLEFVVPDHDGGVGYTVLCLAERVETARALVVLGDTLFRFPQPSLRQVETSYLLTSPVEECFRWCLVESDERRRAVRFIDKPETYAGPGRALIGVYAFHDIESLRRSLATAWAQGGGRRVELSSALRLYGRVHPLECVDCGDWSDCGHPDNLIKSRRRMLQTRSFNRIEFNERLGTITKRSEDPDKFTNEIQYYHLLPEPLRVLFPRVVASDAHGAEPFLEMEYYGYPSLSELFVLECLDRRVWGRVFRNLRGVLDLMGRYHRPADLWSRHYIYLLRTEERTARLAAQDPHLARLLVDERPVRINGVPSRTFASLWPAAKGRFQSLMQAGEFTVIHGDMCFTNILYDLGADLCKFVDPRGSFGHPGVYGDPRYDVAKLYHSAHGLYDFIVNDLFSVGGSGDDYELRLHAGRSVEDIQAALFEVFDPAFDRREVLLIEGLLFLTMGVFHRDRPRRQQAMVLRGLEIWNDLMGVAGEVPSMTGADRVTEPVA